MKKSDALAVTGIDPKVIGPELVKQAQEEQRKAVQAHVVEGVREMINDVQRSEAIIRQHQERIAIQKRRIAALNDGAFTAEYNSELAMVIIMFNDKTLQVLSDPRSGRL